MPKIKLITTLLCLNLIILSGCNLFDKRTQSDDKETGRPVEQSSKQDEINAESMKIFAAAIQYRVDGRYQKAIDTLWDINPASSVFGSACLEFIRIGGLIHNRDAILFGARRYTQLFPDDAEVLYIYARTLIQDPTAIEKAEAIIKNLLELKAESQYYELLAEVQLLNNRHNAAEQTVLETMKNLESSGQEPSISLLILQARALIGQQFFDKSASILDEIVTNNPSRREPLLIYLSILNNRVKYKEVVSNYLTLNPSDLEVTVVAAEFFLKQGDYQTSAEFFEKALALRPDNLVLSRKLAECFMMLGEHRKTITALQNILKLTPNDEHILKARDEALKNHIQRLKDSQDWANAERFLQIYSFNKPDDVGLFQEIAYFQEKQGQLAKARITHQIIIDNIKINKKSIKEIVRLSLLLNDKESAFSNLQKIITLEPDKDEIMQFIQLALNLKYYKEAFNACRLIYLEIFKDKKLYELYREVVFRTLNTTELKNILDDSLAEWQKSNNEFKKISINICIKELENLEKNNFVLTSESMRSSIFVPDFLSSLTFQAKNEAIFVTQILLEETENNNNEIQPNNRESTSSEGYEHQVQEGLKLALRLLSTLKILECDIDKLSYWNVIVQSYQLLQSPNFSGSLENIQSALALFPDAFKHNIDETSKKKLHNLRATLLLRADEKNSGEILNKVNFSRMLVSDLSRTDVNLELATNAAIALTNASERSPEAVLDALHFAKIAEMLGKNEKFKLPSFWETATTIQGDYNDILQYCFNRMLRWTLEGSFIPDAYLMFLNFAEQTSNIQEIQTLDERINNLLSVETRNAARAVLFQIKALCNNKINNLNQELTSLQYALVEIEMQSRDYLTTNQLIFLRQRHLDILSVLADVYQKLKQPLNAAEIYKKIIKNNPSDALAYPAVIKALHNAQRKDEIPYFQYQYLLNIKDSRDFRKWWADFAREISLAPMLHSIKNKEFESIRAQISQLVSKYPDAPMFSFIFADLLAYDGETLKSVDERRNIIKQMERTQSKGLILPALEYLNFVENWRVLNNCFDVCDNLLQDEPDYLIIKVRTAIKLANLDDAFENIKLTEKALEGYQDSAIYLNLQKSLLIEKTRYYIKSVSAESAMAFLSSLDIDLRVQLREEILSQIDFEPLWLSTAVYQLLRCTRIDNFRGELINGRIITGTIFYEDDLKIHLRAPDGTFSIIYKKDIKR